MLPSLTRLTSASVAGVRARTATARLSSSSSSSAAAASSSMLTKTNVADVFVARRSLSSSVETSARGRRPGFASSSSSSSSSLSSAQLIALEETHNANNYKPMPLVMSRARACKVTDPEGREYYDFLSAYSAINQGHCHPRLVAAMVEQAQRLTLTSRAFYNDEWPRFAAFATEFFGYDKVLPMNTGAEAVETAIKIARRWGYRRKGIAANEALIVSACGCFHGRTTGIVSFSCDPQATADFGPSAPGHVKVDFDDIAALEAVFERDGARIAAYLVEPIQGEAGVVVPSPGYFAAVRRLCDRHNVLLIADEVQTGVGRTGKLLAIEHEGVRADIVTLGKAVSGGMYPVSLVLADADVMSVIDAGSHGSTYGGNPMAAVVSRAALEVVRDEQLVERAAVLGARFRDAMSTHESPFVDEVRGRGLLNAIVMRRSLPESKSAMDLCMLLKQRGLLAKPTHGHIVRLAPPLVMTDAEFDECLEIVQRALRDFETIDRDTIEGVTKTADLPPPTAPGVCERCGREVE